MSGLFGLDRPQGYTSIGQGSDDVIKNDQAYLVQGTAGTVNPGWTWFFDSQPRTWLAPTSRSSAHRRRSRLRSIS